VIPPTQGAASSSSPAAGAPTAQISPTPAAAQFKLGGTFKMSYQGEAANLDPHLLADLGSNAYGPGIAYSKLVQYRTDVKPGETVPTGDLAESWEQPDEVTYIFKLRAGAKFQNIAPVNGRAVQAEDVKYSFDRQIALKANAGRLPGIDKIDVVDRNTVKLTAPKPDADFLISLAYASNRIIPRETVDLKGDLKEGPIIGSGAWISDNYQKDRVASLARNPDYYFKGFPRADRIDILRVLDASTVFSAFRAKELDAITSSILTTQDVDTIKKANADVVAESYRDAGGVSIQINASKPPFSDIRVRQAIFKAIDKQAIMDTIYGGKAWYYAGVRMPSADYYLPDDEIRALYKQDLAAARQLLTQAGVTPELELYALGFGTTFKDTSELIQADLAKVGIKARIRVSDSSAQWIGPIQTGESGGYDLAIGSGVAISTNSDLSRYYYGAAPLYIGKVKDPAFDAMVDKQAGLVKDSEGRKKILQDIQRYIINSAQTVYLAGKVSHSVRWPYVKDYFYAQITEEAYPRLWLDK
jgi:peptide/nickel transport system substrate-binding protein